MTSLSVEALWHTFHEPLERFIRNRVPDRDTAADLLQDVYLKIYLHIGTLCDQERLHAWVYQIARNIVHDHYRAAHVQQPLIEITEAVADPDPPEPDEEFSGRLAQTVRNMIDELPDEYREALLLTEYEGLSQQALAERSGLSLSGAKSRVQRGRKLLRELLLECCNFQFDRLGKVIDYYPRCECCGCAQCAN